MWTEHRNASGRVYWYHSVTQQSVWEKPQELKNPLELALAELGWKQYESNGKPYFVNDSTKETVWEIPNEVRAKADQAAAERIKAEAKAGTAVANVQPAAIAVNGGSPVVPMDPANMQLAAPGQFGPGGGSFTPAGPAGPNNLNTHVDLDFNTKDEAERAFFEMLRKYNVTPAWTWEQVLRTTVTDPYFKALRSLGERKAAFEKYCEDVKRREREAKEKSLERNRPAWRTALGRLSEGDYGMKSWWSWDHASRAIRDAVPDVWHMSRHDEERETLWREYMDELARKEEKRQQEIRQGNIEKLAAILNKLDIDLGVKYNDARGMVRNSPEWIEDTQLQGIEPLDFLIVYEESVKKSEQEAEKLKHKAKVERQRQIRKNREAYIALLDDLKRDGKIRAGSKWKEVYPLIRDDERFIEMLANPGSTPLELFWDAVDDLDYKIEEDSRIIENALHERTGGTFKVTPDTTFEEFDSKISDHPRVKHIKQEDRQAVHKALLDRLAVQAREERRRAERRLRHQIDDLRHAIRKVDPPLEDPSLPYEDAVSRISALAEYKDLEGQDEARRSAYDKHIKRLLEKRQEEEEAEQRRQKRAAEEAEEAVRRKARHSSRTATEIGGDMSPARSDYRSSRRTKERELSPALSSTRRATSRDIRDDDRSDKREVDRRERERDSRSSRSYRDKDGDGRKERDRYYEDEEERRSRRQSSRREEVDERDSSHRRSSRRDEGEEELPKRGEERSSRRRDAEDKPVNGEERESKRVKVDKPDDGDKEEGEI